MLSSHIKSIKTNKSSSLLFSEKREINDMNDTKCVGKV